MVCSFSLTINEQQSTINDSEVGRCGKNLGVKRFKIPDSKFKIEEIHVGADLRVCPGFGVRSKNFEDCRGRFQTCPEYFQNN